MSDDLIADCLLAVECLAETNTFETGQAILKEAANRIEELEGQLQSVLDRETSILRYYDAKLDAAEAKLAKAEALMFAGFAEYERRLALSVEFTKGVIRHAGNSGDDYLAEQARTTLTELKGQDDE